MCTGTKKNVYNFRCSWVWHYKGSMELLVVEYCFDMIEMDEFEMILSFRTVRSGQTVQTQIRLLLEEQSDQGLHYCNAISINTLW